VDKALKFMLEFAVKTMTFLHTMGVEALKFMLEFAVKTMTFLHTMGVDFFKPLLGDMFGGFFNGFQGVWAGCTELFVTLKSAAKEVWRCSTTLNVSRLLATAVLLAMSPPVAKTLMTIMETNVPTWTGASTCAPAAPAAGRGPAPPA
jgi:hypothetical protein